MRTWMGGIVGAVLVSGSLWAGDGAICGPASAGTIAPKPTLYALAIGVTLFDDAAQGLVYSAKDATDVAAALRSQKGRFYADVQVRVLTDAEASAGAVKFELAWLARQPSDRDVAIVFAAGRAVADASGGFWFLTSDADVTSLDTTSVRREDITDVLSATPGKKVLFLDVNRASASGTAATSRFGPPADLNVVLNQIGQDDVGTVAYAASTGREPSLERADWGNGAFAKALIEGLGEGKADLMRSNTISVEALEVYIESRVKDLTGGRQHPVMVRPPTMPDFPIAAAR